MEPPSLGAAIDWMCWAVHEALDGWALLRILQTCQGARRSAWVHKITQAKQGLLALLHYIRSAHLVMPGFDFEAFGSALLVSQLYRLESRSICIHPPSIMRDCFVNGTPGKLRAWMRQHRALRAMDAVSALHAMNRKEQHKPEFVHFINTLRRGSATFHFSPAYVEKIGDELDAEDFWGIGRNMEPVRGECYEAGLIVCFHYQAFAVALCFREFRPPDLPPWLWP